MESQANSSSLGESCQIQSSGSEVDVDATASHSVVAPVGASGNADVDQDIVVDGDNDDADGYETMSHDELVRGWIIDSLGSEFL